MLNTGFPCIGIARYTSFSANGKTGTCEGDDPLDPQESYCIPLRNAIGLSMRPYMWSVSIPHNHIKDYSKMENEIAEKVASVAKKLASSSRKKMTEKEVIISAIKKQKTQFRKALKNGYTRRDIIAKLRDDGIKISPKDLADILGTRKQSLPNNDE
jgi:hypothetical protein